MKIERHNKGEYRCFSVGNTLLTRTGAVRIIRKIPLVYISKKPRLFGGQPFCEFTYKQKEFYIEEPWGDSSQFDIVCNEPNTQELETIALAFEAKKCDIPSLIFAIIFFGVLSTSLGSIIYKWCNNAF